MTYPCRCLTRVNGAKCTQRKALRQKPEDYLRQPKCPQCGKRSWYVDKYRMKVEMAHKATCGCSGYHFPHRKGSKFCYHNANAEVNHTERFDGAIA